MSTATAKADFQMRINNGVNNGVRVHRTFYVPEGDSVEFALVSHDSDCFIELATCDNADEIITAEIPPETFNMFFDWGEK